MLGPVNLDLRSLLLAHFLNVAVYDEAAGHAKEISFAQDQIATDEVTLEQLQQRPLKDRLKQWLAGPWAYCL
jgi:cardiolipin synthase